jgi:hypothetical protein
VGEVQRWRQSLNNHNTSGLALQLCDCYPKDLQTILRSNGMGSHSTKPELLSQMKVVTVTTQNVLVNMNNFLCMRQQKVESVRLYLGRLKGAARHCDFTLYMDKPPTRTR